MAGVVSRAGLVFALEELRPTLNNMTLHLFSNNATPDDTFTNADVVESAFSGYSSIALVGWGAAFLNPANIGEIQEVLRTFTRAAGAVSENVYGYFVRDSNGDYWGGERNPAGPYAMDTPGKVYPVWLRATLQNA